MTRTQEKWKLLKIEKWEANVYLLDRYVLVKVLEGVPSEYRGKKGKVLATIKFSKSYLLRFEGLPDRMFYFNQLTKWQHGLNKKIERLKIVLDTQKNDLIG